MMLSADELLAGSALTFEVTVPAGVLRPGADAEPGEPATVRLRPLTVADLQVVTRAAEESDALTATLMVQRALVEPELSVTDVTGMPVGVLEFLLERVNELSGLALSRSRIAEVVDAPLSKATHVLAEGFGWTPSEVSELTLGQVLVHLEMLGERARPAHG